MKYELVVVADTNDGDYVTEISEINEKCLEWMRPIIEAIKENNGSFEIGEIARESLAEQYPNLSEDDLEEFQDYVPYGMYGTHTIDSITVAPLAEKERLL